MTAEQIQLIHEFQDVEDDNMERGTYKGEKLGYSFMAKHTGNVALCF